MSNVKKFYEAMAADAALQEKARLLDEKYEGQDPDKNVLAQELIAMATQAGYPFTPEELEAYSEEVKKQAQSRRALDDDELDAVAGGHDHRRPPCPAGECWDTCFCVLGGYGFHNRPQRNCVCVVAGFGGDDRGVLCRLSLKCAIGGGVSFHGVRDWMR